MGGPLIIPERLISGLDSTSALNKREEGLCPGNEVKAMEVGDQLTNAFLDRESRGYNRCTVSCIAKHRESFH